MSEICFKSTHNSKQLSRILIQIDLWLKNYPEYWFELSQDSMIWINCWICWLFWAFINFVDIFWAFTDFIDPFWAFAKFCWPFLGIWLKCLNLNQPMTQAVPQRLESIKLMNQAVFQVFHSESTHDSSGFTYLSIYFTYQYSFQKPWLFCYSIKTCKTDMLNNETVE